MAPHGRPKLKRPPRVGLPDLSKTSENETSTRPASTSRRRSTTEASSEQRVKTPTPEQSSTTEVPVSSKVKSPTDGDRGSPDPNCAICLGKLRNKSFTDSCLHQFCFKCLVQWSKVKPECPLCKQAFKSIIHNVRSNEDYDQYHCRPPPTPRSSLIDELITLPGFSRFRYRTTQVSGSRRTRTFNETTIHELFLHHHHHHDNMPYVIPSAPRCQPRTRQVVTSAFRANIYDQDLWIQEQPDITGRYRECSPEFYRLNPAQMHRLVPWLDREIPNVISSNMQHAQVIINIILSLLAHHHIQSRAMYRRLRPIFGIRTSHFLHEFHAFARSPFDMIGFDNALMYGPNPNPTVFTPAEDEAIHFSDSDNSDVIILEPGVEPVAGPSGVRRRPRSVAVPVDPVNSQSIATSNQESTLVVDDSDDCEIVGFVKPRHERTPEIIVLSDTDEDAEDGRNGANQNGDNFWQTMQQVHESLNALSDILSPDTPSPDSPFSISDSISSSTSESTSTSEYKPYTLRSASKKSTVRKSKKKSKSSHTKNKSSKKPAKMRAQSISSDSEEDENISRRSSKIKRHTKSMKERSRRVARIRSSSSSCGSGRVNSTGASETRRNTFSIRDSLSGHRNSYFYEDNAAINSDDDTRRRIWPPSGAEPLVYKPDIGNCPIPIISTFVQEMSQPPIHDDQPDQPSVHPKPARDTWCIKPSASNQDDTSDEDSSRCSSGSEFRPKLKSIVIMRTNNNSNNNNIQTRTPSTMSHRGSCWRRSRSPVASTSRAGLQSYSSSDGSQSLSRHSQSNSFSARTSHYSSKCKKFKREERSRTRSDSESRSDSDSNWSRKVKRPRTSKWQFNESSDDSSY